MQAKVKTVAGSAADAAVAAGGIVFTNAAFSFGIGLPAGRAGLAIGAALLAAGITGLKGTAERKARSANVEPVRTIAGDVAHVERTRRAA